MRIDDRQRPRRGVIGPLGGVLPKPTPYGRGRLVWNERRTARRCLRHSLDASANEAAPGISRARGVVVTPAVWSIAIGAVGSTT